MKIENKIILFFFSAASLYLLVNFSIAYGVFKERESSICVSPYQIQQWRNAVKVAEGVYLNVADVYTDELEKTKQEAQKWRDSYFLLKRQTEIDLVDTKLFN